MLEFCQLQLWVAGYWLMVFTICRTQSHWGIQRWPMGSRLDCMSNVYVFTVKNYCSLTLKSGLQDTVVKTTNKSVATAGAWKMTTLGTMSLGSCCWVAPRVNSTQQVGPSPPSTLLTACHCHCACRHNQSTESCPLMRSKCSKSLALQADQVSQARLLA